MNHRLIAVFVLIVLLAAVFFSSCKAYPYDEEWIIGKSSVEIEKRYGKFDRLDGIYNTDGLLYSCDAGYVVTPSHIAWYGKSIEELLVVRFNNEGVAVSCEIAPGNWGG